ncbi:HPP family protein [Rhodopirellula baltica]
MLGSRWLGVELVEVSLHEKLISAVGSACAIYCVFYVTNLCLPGLAAAGVIASMGASAVLLYAVPHGPLSQPWPLVAGHTISACIGVTCYQWISHPALATALAVGISIGLMYQLRCIHPPGGATAFTAVMGGDAIHELGYMYVLCPILLNVALMLALAVLINAPFRWRRYPAGLFRSANEGLANERVGSAPSHEQVLAAIRSLDSFVDVSEDDLVRLVRELGGADDLLFQSIDHSQHKVSLSEPQKRTIELTEDPGEILKRSLSDKSNQMLQ